MYFITCNVSNKDTHQEGLGNSNMVTPCLLPNGGKTLDKVGLSFGCAVCIDLKSSTVMNGTLIPNLL